MLFAFAKSHKPKLGKACVYPTAPKTAKPMIDDKSSSSHFINQNNLIAEKFAWQTGYAAYPVSASVGEKVFHYIINQKQHHKKKSFQHEYDEFLKLYEVDNEK